MGIVQLSKKTYKLQQSNLMYECFVREECIITSQEFCNRFSSQYLNATFLLKKKSIKDCCKK